MPRGFVPLTAEFTATEGHAVFTEFKNTEAQATRYSQSSKTPRRRPRGIHRVQKHRGAGYAVFTEFKNTEANTITSRGKYETFENLNTNHEKHERHENKSIISCLSCFSCLSWLEIGICFAPRSNTYIGAHNKHNTEA